MSGSLMAGRYGPVAGREWKVARQGVSGCRRGRGQLNLPDIPSVPSGRDVFLGYCPDAACPSTFGLCLRHERRFTTPIRFCVWREADDYIARKAVNPRKMIKRAKARRIALPILIRASVAVIQLRKSRNFQGVTVNQIPATTRR